MADPGALSATFGQVSITSGLGTYTLGKTIRDKLPISEGYDDGMSFTYHVTDTSGTVEITTGTYTLSLDNLTRDTLVLSSTGSFINWPDSGQRIITPIVIPFPLCDDPPMDGQALLWNETIMKYCPGDIASGDDDTWDMQDVMSGTSV